MTRDQKIDELLSVFLHFKRQLVRSAMSRQENGLTIAQTEMLFCIAKGNSRTRDIAIEQNITPSGATQQIQLLEAAGLVERRMSEQDRRESSITLTDKGETTLRNCRHDIHQNLKQYVMVLDDEEIDEFIQIMKKMLARDASLVQVKGE